MNTRADILTELLVIRAQNGDSKAFEGLVRQWQPRMLRHAMQLTENPEAGLDIMQDAWIEVSRNIHQLKKPDSFRSWFYKIVRNKCVDWIRREQTQRKLSKCISENKSPDITNTIDEEKSINQIRLKLRTLPRDQRQILTLFYLDELSVNDIGLALNIPVGTVKSRLYYARKMLKETLEE